jgi:CspA family cold shock protein
VLDPTPSLAKAKRKQPEEMVRIVEDLIQLLDGVEQSYRRGRQPESKTARQTAALLRRLADELEL